MNLFALTSLLLCLACYALSLLIFIFSKQKLHRYWAYFNLAVGTYGLGMFLAGITKNYDQSFLYWKIAYCGVGSIGMFFYLVVYEFCNLANRKMRSFVYIHGFAFSLLAVSTDWIVNSLRFAFKQFYLPIAGPWWNILFAIWIVIVVKAFVDLYNYTKTTRGLRRVQGKYLFYAMLLGFLSGASTSLTTWGVDIYPIWHFLVCIYAAICTYAIFKYRLMDIRVAVSRAGVFGIVYALVLGIPFALGWWGRDYLSTKLGIHWWLVPTGVCAVLATVGPFIYLFLQRKTENRILREERKIQQFLMQASSGMTTIRDLKKLLGLIIHLVSKTLRVNNAAIYLSDPNNNNKYTLKEARFKQQNPISIDINDPLIQWLKKDDAPLVYEEIKMRVDMESKNHALQEIASQMKDLSASVIIPTVMEDKLLGFLVIGERKPERMYTPDLLNALSVLANQAALAIENARFYESDRENQALLYQSATLADMGVMADSMGHQIKNHIQKMMGLAGTEAGMLEEYLNQDLSHDKAIELLRRYLEVFGRIEEQGKKGGELIASISKFSRLPQEAFKELTISEILNTANDILKFKIKFDQFDYVVDVPDDLPLIYAHPILSEAFVNLIDNAYDAIKEKEERFNERGYRGKITFQAKRNDANRIEIKISDNGIGIEKNNLSHLFLPFYTTKSTAAKGTGLGLFVLKKIIDNHKGRISVESEYKQGSTFTITLPIKTGTQKR